MNSSDDYGDSCSQELQLYAEEFLPGDLVDLRHNISETVLGLFISKIPSPTGKQEFLFLMCSGPNAGQLSTYVYPNFSRGKETVYR